MPAFKLLFTPRPTGGGRYGNAGRGKTPIVKRLGQRKEAPIAGSFGTEARMGETYFVTTATFDSDASVVLDSSTGEECPRKAEAIASTGGSDDWHAVNPATSAEVLGTGLLRLLGSRDGQFQKNA